MILSICVPTFNRLSYLAECLTSIEIATKKITVPIEVFVSNNNSEDGTKELLANWRFSNPQVSFSIRNQLTNVGPLQNIYQIIDSAQGEYLLWCSDDDQLTSEIVTKSVEYANVGKFGFIKFGLVVYDIQERTTYLSGPNFQIETDKQSSRSFLKIHSLAHILTGTLVKQSVASSVTLDRRKNIYPMAQWCSLSYENLKYDPYPAAVHIYANLVSWGDDVEPSSIGRPGKQSVSDMLESISSLKMTHSYQKILEGAYLKYGYPILKFQGSREYFSKATGAKIAMQFYVEKFLSRLLENFKDMRKF